MLDISQSAVISKSKTRDFPKPLFVLARARFWLRAEIEAYHAGEPARNDRRCHLSSVLGS